MTFFWGREGGGRYMRKTRVLKKYSNTNNDLPFRRFFFHCDAQHGNVRREEF